MDSVRYRLVREYGEDPIAYSTLQEDMRYFETSYGYIAYRHIMGIDITLGPPICPRHDREQIIGEFLKHSKRPLFSYISQDTVSTLGDSGMYCSSMGIDRHVDLHALLNSPGKAVSGALKKSNKVNFALRPLDFQQCDAEQIERLKAISKAYLGNALYSRELSFINRPMQYHNDGMLRAFTLNKYDKEHQGVFGYAVLNPYFQEGEIKGYLLDILRFEPTRLWGVWLSTVWHIAKILEKERLHLTLGFCPLYDLQEPTQGSSSLLNWQTRCAARLLRNSQYVRRLFELKSEIPGWQEPRYFASYSRNLIRHFLAFLNASGMSTHQLFGPELLRSMWSGFMPKVKNP